MHPLRRKYSLALLVLLIVLAAVGLKIGFYYLNLEYIELNSLISTVISGAMFLTGFILSGTIADYKESEKLPSDVAGALENLYQEGLFVKRSKPSFDLVAHNSRLLAIVDSIIGDLFTCKEKQHRRGLEASFALCDSMLELDCLGATASTTRIRTEQSNLNKAFLRAYQIKDTSFIPGAYAIVEIMALFVYALILFSKTGEVGLSHLILTSIIYILVYMVMFIRDIDDPFERRGYADVDIFLLKDFRMKIVTDVESAVYHKSS